MAAMLFAAVLVGCCWCAPGQSHATPEQDRQSQSTAPIAVDPPLDLTDIKRKIAEIRELEFLREVPSRVQPIEEFGEHVRKDIDKYFPPDRQQAIVRGLMRLGLLSEPIDFGGAFTDAFMTQAAAYYNPETGTFYYLVVDLPAMALRTIAAHELVHALQDQHFDLKKMFEQLEEDLPQLPRNDDRMLAIRFLVEGEATYVHTLYQTPILIDNEAMREMTLQSMAAIDIDRMVEMTRAQAAMMGDENPMADAMKAMDQIPPYILHPLYAAYMQGAMFVLRVHEQGGWDAVAAVYEDLPESSEQVLNPAKYTTNRDRPTRLKLPQFSALEDEGWDLLDSAIHGEYYLRLLLRQNGVPRAQANRAARGWDGDVYAAFGRYDDETAIVLATTWDTEQDAREFFDTYRAALVHKYPDRENIASNSAVGRIAYHCGEGLGDGWLVLRGREVFAVEGVSVTTGAMVLIDLLEMEIEYVD